MAIVRVALFAPEDGDPERWSVTGETQRYTRIAADRYRFESVDGTGTVTYGVLLDVTPDGVARRYGDEWHLDD